MRKGLLGGNPSTITIHCTCDGRSEEGEIRKGALGTSNDDRQRAGYRKVEVRVAAPNGDRGPDPIASLNRGAERRYRPP